MPRKTPSERAKETEGVRRTVAHYCAMCEEEFVYKRGEKYTPHWRYVLHLFHEHRNILCVYTLSGGYRCGTKCPGIWGMMEQHFCIECRSRKIVKASIKHVEGDGVSELS